MDERIVNMNILNNVNEIKSKALYNRYLLRNFLEGFIINGGKNINDYITFKLLNEIEKDINPNYTYWIDTGLTWLLWYEKNYSSLDEEIKSSITTGFYKINYVFNDYSYREKIVELYNFTNELKEQINRKLTEQGLEFYIEIVLKNIEIKPDGSFNYIYDTKTLFKEPSYRISLVIKKGMSGGARKPRKRTNNKTFKKIGEFTEKITIDDIKINESLFKELNNDTFNNKIIIDFNIDYYHTKKTEGRELNIEQFKNNYLIIFKGTNKTYEETKLKITNREKLNRLNEYGMMTYCLLNLSVIDDEFGLNIDKYRRELFFKNKSRTSIPIFLEKILELYKIFDKFKSYNEFFIDKVNEYINKFKSIHFEIFKDFIDRWFVSMFRPSINSFILEINEELYKKFGVLLFIAGGDAMRRYENDISFTKDIDTKLYINNVEIKDETIKEELDKIGDENQKKIIIKDKIVEIIVRHIVKLRNFLEQNIKKIFNKLLSYDEKIIDHGTEVITFKTDDNHKFKLNILLGDTDKEKYQQFRTRENKKRSDFPVDLYSIDFRTFISEYDENDKLIRKKIHDISLLDVVLQDTDNFYDYYYTIVDDIPVASLRFLLEDFYKTYTTDDRALARISSGKVEKDIIRFYKIKELYMINNQGTQTKLYINNIDEIISELDTLISDKTDVNYFKLMDFLLKIKNKKICVIMNITSFNKIIKDPIYYNFINRYADLNRAIIDMIYFKKNIYNEMLNLTLNEYTNYTVDDDIIRQGYYELFSKLCSINNNDKLLRHVIMFSNPKIMSSFEKMNIKKKVIKAVKLPTVKQSSRKSTSKGISKSSKTPAIVPQITTVSQSGRLIKITQKYVP
jgi:hypothetical protein